MERKNLSNTLKDHSIGSNNSKLKDSWNYNSQGYGDQDYLGGFSWPPRSYTCSFCKREFRSAQALGGHMNVHRRDRARLRQSPPPPRDAHCRPILNLNMNPNPNPSFSTCKLPSLVSPPLFASSSMPSFVSSSEIRKWAVDGTLLDDHLRPRSSDLTRMEGRKSLLAASGCEEHFTQKDGCKYLNKAEIVRLDLEIGLVRDHTKEDLDLELRLGYS